MIPLRLFTALALLGWLLASSAAAQAQDALVSVVESSTGLSIASRDATLHIETGQLDARTITGAQIDIDGIPVGHSTVVVTSETAATVTFSVPQRDSEAVLTLQIGGKTSRPVVIPIKWTGAPAERPKVNLYSLLIGIGKYQDPDLRLATAAKDVEAVAHALQTQQTRFYEHVETRILLDEEASVGQILTGLDQLEQEVTSRDNAVVYLAGRAIRDDTGEVYFLTSQSTLDSASLKANALPANVLKEKLGMLAGRVLLFLDACSSQNFVKKGGKNADLTALIEDLASPEAGIIVFTSCTGKDIAPDAPHRPNGAFAEALVSGFESTRTYSDSGYLLLTALDRSLSAEVGKLSGGKQHAALVKPDTIPDFPIASLPVVKRTANSGDEPTPIDVELLPAGGDVPAKRSATAISAESISHVRLLIRNARQFRRLAIDEREVTPDAYGIVDFERSPDADPKSLRLTGVDGAFRLSFANVLAGAQQTNPEITGRRYALIIAIDKYRDFSGLATPRNDGEAIAKVLTGQFGFETSIRSAGGSVQNLMLLDDPTRSEIFDTMIMLGETLGENDALLIYFAGHGYQTDESSPAFWVPSDGRPGRTYTYIDAKGLLDQIQQMRARSVLIISDSCFSGGLFRAAAPAIPAGTERDAAIDRLAVLKSRVFISSGGSEPVLDRGCRQSVDHSIFACAFLSGLRELEPARFRSLELFNAIDQRVVANAKQTPRWNEIYAAGHEGGDFVFERH
ncbi:hypothetical protein BH10PSE7_BH10PSE7_01090 [soil metagenome]